VVWECLEEAGYTPAALQRAAGRVGVFVGVMWQDHQQVGADLWRRTGAATLSATASDIPNRISHVLDLRGPSLAVDTSCASSLTALHLAMQSIRAGECGAAIVAAVNLVAHPYHIAALAGLDLLARNGATAAFDAGSSGWSPGEGAGALLLRPAARADDDGDAVHAVIEGTWVGHAGHTNRFGAPNADRLADSLDAALRQCGIEPDDIDYVECAAAGATVADAAEIEALARIFGNRPVPIGTVKPNIGHLESASGLAQLAKVLLQMRNEQLAPTLTAERPNPLIPWESLPLRPVRRLEPWPAGAPGRPRRALVNALGATGSYGHVVVRAVDGG